MARHAVQVDILTGATEVLQTDILFDCGVSLNPDVDIGTLSGFFVLTPTADPVSGLAPGAGQVEGAFIQGLGYFLTEYIEYDPSGKLVTNGYVSHYLILLLCIIIYFNLLLLLCYKLIFIFLSFAFFALSPASTWEYKPPSQKDIPIRFNVALLKGTLAPHACV
jgi:xanthine dehydrogenase molybdopterin-binding subunit B